MLALVLGLIVSAGLYFAYLWPSVEPVEEETAAAPTGADPAAPEPVAAPATPAPAPEESAAT